MESREACQTKAQRLLRVAELVTDDRLAEELQRCAQEWLARAEALKPAS